MVDPKLVMEFMAESVPFNATLKEKFTRLTQYEAEIVLDVREEITNHIGTLHAGALFSLAETGAGAVCAMNFDVLKYLIVLKSSEIRYFKTVGKQARSVTRIAPEVIAEATRKLEAGEKAQAPVEAIIYNEKNEEAIKATYTIGFVRL